MICPFLSVKIVTYSFLRPRVSFALLMLILLISPLNASCLSSSPKGNKVVSKRVLWTVSAYRLSANAAWGEKDAEKMLFKQLDRDENSITFDGMACLNVNFNKVTVNTRSYLDRTFKVTPETLGIRDKAMEVISTNCDLPGFGTFMRLQDSSLVLHINGVFFFLEPAVSY